MMDGGTDEWIIHDFDTWLMLNWWFIDCFFILAVLVKKGHWWFYSWLCSWRLFHRWIVMVLCGLFMITNGYWSFDTWRLDGPWWSPTGTNGHQWWSQWFLMLDLCMAPWRPQRPRGLWSSPSPWGPRSGAAEERWLRSDCGGRTAQVRPPPLQCVAHARPPQATRFSALQRSRPFTGNKGLSLGIKNCGKHWCFSYGKLWYKNITVGIMMANSWQ